MPVRACSSAETGRCRMRQHVRAGRHTGQASGSSRTCRACVSCLACGSGGACGVHEAIRCVHVVMAVMIHIGVQYASSYNVVVTAHWQMQDETAGGRTCQAGGSSEAGGSDEAYRNRRLSAAS